MLNNLQKSIFTLLFGLLTSAYLWIRNEMSDRWIVIFFSVILANEVVEIGHELTLKNLRINNYLSVIGYMLFLVHPLINALGAYTQLEGGLRLEPVGLAVLFIMYKLFVKPIPFEILNTTTKGKGFIYNYANYLTKYELAAYLALLIFPMILYDPPKNAIMMTGTLFSLFAAYMLNKRKLDRSMTHWYSFMTSLLGINALFL
jgi:hypothetical protein